MLEGWGRVVHRRRWLVLAASLVLLAASGVLLARGGEFGNFDSVVSSESGRASALLNSQLPRATGAPAGTTVLFVFESDTLLVTDPLFQKALLDAIVGAVGGVFALSHVTTGSPYALNLVPLTGLGTAIDYSLFIVARFREELAHGASREDALARARGTAGRAVVFSGVTVAIGLSGMLFFEGTFLSSLGVAAAIVVASAVLNALTDLPALLSILGPRVNAWRVPLPQRQATGNGFWHSLATAVMRRPLIVLIPTVAFVLAVGSPFLQLRLA